jgi:DNA-binding NarL/FixJ family response regulator
MKLSLGKNKKTRVLIAEDESLIRKAICLLVGSFSGIEVVGEASNGKEAADLVTRLKPDLILMDLVMPVMDGVAASALVKASNPRIKVLALTAHGEGPEVLGALSNGADGIVLKKAPPEELKHAMEAILGGEKHIPRSIAERLAASLAKGAVPEDGSFTPREQQVLSLIISGCRAKEISKVLGISERTVEKHRDNLRRKYKVQTTAGLVAIHLKHHDRNGD